MAKPKPIVLFSTNTLLAFRINEKYFGSKHFVYCNPFSHSQAAPRSTVMPPSSTPCTLFKAFENDSMSNDAHSAVIAQNRVGLLRGADAKRKRGVITAEQETEIKQIVDVAENQEFKPLLYVVPYARVARLVKPVPAANKAHAFSEEFIIEELPREAFEFIEF